MADNNNNQTNVNVDINGNLTPLQRQIEAARNAQRQLNQEFAETERRVGNIAKMDLPTGLMPGGASNSRQLAERQALMARDRRQAFGGAAMFSAQTDVLRNYMALGAAVGTGGFLANFVVTAERELANLQAISNATNGDMERLTGTFERLAEQSKFTFQEIAQGSVVLAQAGFSARDINEMLGAIMNLATATGSEFATAVDIATSVLSVFHLEAGQTAQVTDMLTEAMNRSKLNMEQFRLGVQYAGNLAAEQGVGIRELTAAMASMADQGIRSGSTMGTGLRQLFTDLIDPTEDAIAHFQAFGLSMEDLNVRSHGLFGVLENLERAGFSSADAFQTFEVRAAAAYAALTANLPAAREMLTTLDSTGQAARAAATQMDTLSARGTQFSNALGVAATKVLEPLVDVFKDIVLGATELVRVLGNLAPLWQLALPVAIVTITRSVATSIVQLAQGMLTYNATGTNTAAVMRRVGIEAQLLGVAVQGPATALNATTAASARATAGVATFGSAAGAARAASLSLTTSLRGLTAAMLANPFTAVVTAITAVVTALMLWDSWTTDAAEKADEFASNAAELSGELDMLGGRINTVSQEMDRVAERSAALSDETMTAAERQAELDQIIAESISNVEGLSTAFDGQITSLEQLQQALRDTQLEYIELARTRALNLEQELRNQAREEGRAAQEAFRNFQGGFLGLGGERALQGARDQQAAMYPGRFPNGDRLPPEVAALYRDVINRREIDQAAYNRLTEALAGVSRNLNLPREQRNEADRILDEMRNTFAPAMERAAEALNEADRARTTWGALNVSERVLQNLDVQGLRAEWERRTSELRDSLEGEELRAAERSIAQEPQFAQFFDRMNEVVNTQLEVERQRLLREGQTEQAANEEVARMRGEMVNYRSMLAFAGEIRSSGRTPARGRRQRRGPSSEVDLLRFIMEAEEADVDRILSGVSDLRTPELVRQAREDFDTQWSEYVAARLEHFEAEWAHKDYRDPAQAQQRELARAALTRTLESELRERRDRFDDALVNGVIRTMDQAIETAEREFDRELDAARLDLDRVRGRANRGRFGRTREELEERRYEEQVINQLPARIQLYNDQITAAEQTLATLQAELDATTDVETIRQIREDMRRLQTEVDEKTQTRDQLQRRYDVDTQTAPVIPILNPGGGIGGGLGPGGIFSPEFGLQIREMTQLWVESAGIIRDTSDIAVDGIRNTFDALNQSMTESFRGILTGTMDVEDAVKHMATSVLEAILDMAIEIIKNAIIKQAMNFIISMFGGTPMAQGGKVPTKVVAPPKKFASGYSVTGGIPGRDSVHALLQPGEYVLRRSAADLIGKETLDRMNYTGRVANDNVKGVPIAMKREPDMTNVYVVSPDQVPPYTDKDVIVALHRDIHQNGPTKKLIKAVAMGA